MPFVCFKPSVKGNLSEADSAYLTRNFLVKTYEKQVIKLSCLDGKCPHSKRNRMEVKEDI